MTIHLRAYQQTDVDAIRAAYGAGHQRVLYVAPCGAGKGVLFTYIAAQMAARGKRCWILVHRQELLAQTSRNLTAFGVPHGLIAPQFTPDYAAPLQVASVQTLTRRLSKAGEVDLIIADECFPTGTLVDGTPIENIKFGDKVFSFCHQTNKIVRREVLHTMERDYNGSWYRIILSNNQKIICTEGHPIYTVEFGYIPAMMLLQHDAIRFICHEMFALQKENPSKNPQSEPSLQILQSSMLDKTQKESGCIAMPTTEMYGMWQRRSLQKEMLVPGSANTQNSILLDRLSASICVQSKLHNNDSDKFEVPRYFIASNENKKSNVYARNKREDDTIQQGKNVSFARGKWTDYEASTYPSQRYRVRNGIGHCSKKGSSFISEFADLLQGRSWCTEPEISYRGRRPDPQTKKVEIPRCSQDSSFEFVRVANIEIYKPGSRYRPSWVPPKNRVYNLHVAETNNYFANRILVHNCHHAVSPTYRGIIAARPNAKVLGTTATPARLDGRGLGEIFDHMHIGPTVAWLTEHGYLASARVFAPPSAINVTGLHKRGGDFAKDELNARCDVPTITGDAVATYSRICNGVPAIAFCVSVMHAHHVASSFRDAGYRAAAVDGATDDRERKRLIDGLGNGAVQVLTSCDLISEGLDSPAVTAAILLRPTASLALARQQIGRALRPAPNKPAAIILDHCGNILRHGLPTEEIEWSLDGGGKRSKPGVSAPPCRQCRFCYAVFRPNPVCPECGKAQPIEPRTVEHVDGELVEITSIEKDRERAAKKREVQNAKTYEELLLIGKQRGYKNGWAFNQWRIRAQYAEKYRRHG